MDIKNAIGEQEPFDAQKLCNSIRYAGAPEALATHVCGLVEKKLEPNVTTTKIFREALGHLLKENIEVSARYSLKRGVAELGPAGFLFEQYVEAILQAHGYTTRRDVIMQGHCVDHEIDVYAEKGGFHFLVEAKYKNEHALKTHIDVVMYAYARLLDIVEYENKGEEKKFHHSMWVITNTKFTAKAIQYAQCRDIKLVGWDYPEEGNLQDMIVRKKLYPITVLPSVTALEREQFAKSGLVLAQDLLPYGVNDLVQKFNISQASAEKIHEEVKALVA